jgi:hypothetical protein
MSNLNLSKTVSMALVAAAACLSLQVQATTVSTSLNFITSGQSMWGPDAGPSEFNYSGSASIDWPFDVPPSTFGYSVSASSGTVFGNVNGSVVTNYTPVLSAPGVANISLQYLGHTNGGMLSTVIGAAASLTVFGQTFGPSFGLVTSSSFTPFLAPGGVPEAMGLAAYDIADPSIDLVVASGGMDMGVVQITQFAPTGVDGTLFYQREGSSLVQSQAFNLTTGSTLPVKLDRAGTYDFWFGNNWDLQNWFTSSAVLGLTAHASTFVGCGSSGLESCDWSTTLANPTLYSSGPFALDFDAFTQPTKFQIEVQAVPVPDGLGLGTLGGGFLLLVVLDGWRRQRARTPDGTVAGNGKFAISGGVAR